LIGVLAQLVERLNGIEEVRGSNPLGSILLNVNDSRILLREILITGFLKSDTRVDLFATGSVLHSPTSDKMKHEHDERHDKNDVY
jgi:hypothetical protein